MLADRYISNRHGARGARRIEESTFAVLDKLIRSLRPKMAEPFAISNAFARVLKSLFYTMKNSLPTASGCL
jgi:hypothetical protein